MSAALQKALDQIDREIGGTFRRRAAEQERIRTNPTRTEALALQIIANNKRSPVASAADVFSGLNDPSKAKRDHAECILALRRNRIACLEMGWNHHASDVVWLARAAAYRREAVRRINAQKEVA